MIGNTRGGTLYRLFAADGDLLYVGCTMHPATRLPEHREKPWFTQVATATFEHFETRETAARAEAIAIEGEAPRHNKQSVQVVQTDDQLAARSAKRRETEARRRTASARFRAEHIHVPGLHCSNCGWRFGWIRRGKVIAETACPACDVVALTTEPKAAAA